MRQIKYDKCHYLLLFFLILRTLLAYSLSDNRWINVDEGAHLMDGYLILQGLVPDVDFSSRQPVYAFILAISIKFLGTDLFILRLLPLMLDLLCGLLIYQIGTILFNRGTGILASILYFLLPFNFILSLNIKTEPVAMFLGLLGLRFWLAGRMKHNSFWPLFCSGIFIMAAYNVRESSLVLLISIILFIFWDPTYNRREKIRNIFLYTLGGVSLIACLGIYYLSYISFSEFWRLVNPLYFIFESFGTAVQIIQPEASIDIELDKVPLNQRLNSLFFSLKGIAPLLVLSLLALWSLLRKIIAKGTYFLRNRSGFSLSVVATCFIFYTAAYGFYFFKSSFHPFYVRELLPYLAILSGYGLLRLVRSLSLGQRWIAPALIFLLGIIYIHIDSHRELSSLGIYFVASLSIVVLSWSIWRWDKIQSVTRFILVMTGFLGTTLFLRHLLHLGSRATILFLVLEVFLIGILVGKKIWKNMPAFSLLIIIGLIVLIVEERIAPVMNMELECSYRPEILYPVTEIIKANSARDEEVLSGSVIWALAAERKPYLLQSHPLSYLRLMPGDVHDTLTKEIDKTPPKIVVLDGYTERIYLTKLPALAHRLASEYETVYVIDSGMKKEVKVLVYRDRYEKI